MICPIHASIDANTINSWIVTIAICERIHTDVQRLFTQLLSQEQTRSVLDYVKTTHEGHGRREIREVWTTAQLESLSDRER